MELAIFGSAVDDGLARLRETTVGIRTKPVRRLQRIFCPMECLAAHCGIGTLEGGQVRFGGSNDVGCEHVDFDAGISGSLPCFVESGSVIRTCLGSRQFATELTERSDDLAEWRAGHVISRLDADVTLTVSITLSFCLRGCD